METTCTLERSMECRERLICRCLQVTESTLRMALTTLETPTLAEVRRCTGAGDGCTACHRLIKRYLAETL